MNGSRNSRKFIYRVDASDRIIYVNDAWLAFAKENQAKSLTSEVVISRSIWDFICDADTSHLYHVIFGRIRSTKCKIKIPFRCDSPTCRRHMMLKISDQGNGVLQFVGRVIREEPRVYMRVLDAMATRSQHFIKMCSWCKKISIGNDDWAEIEEAVSILKPFSHADLPLVTHGMCSDCYKTVTKKIKATFKH